MELSIPYGVSFDRGNSHACRDDFLPNVSPTSLPLSVAESATVYRARNPEKTTFYQLLEQNFDDYVYAHEERFEPKSGPLRPVVRSTASS